MTGNSIETTAPALLPAGDLPVGQGIDCGSYEVTEDEIVGFASSWDPLYFHVDPHQAVHSDFGGLIASGLHTASIYQRLAVTGLFSRYDVIAGKEIHGMRFLRPVRPGDVLSCSILIQSVEPDRAGRSLVKMLGTLRNQHSKPVLERGVDSIMRSIEAPGPDQRSV